VIRRLKEGVDVIEVGTIKLSNSDLSQVKHSLMPSAKACQLALPALYLEAAW